MAEPILIVDDNPNMSSLLSDMLEVFDYPSVRATDALDALNRLKTKKFAMVITDVRMPKMSGLELLDKIKEQHPRLPVVLISGYSVAEFEAGREDDSPRPDGFLAKPFMMADIENLLNSLL